ncbi:MAG: DUF418 domain-containing protein, partial [Povalibacter sp.]
MRASTRIEALDVLRAFALFGIIVTHSMMSYLAGRPADPEFNIFSSLDSTTMELGFLFANGKFFSIFSFLFGVSFAIQLDRAIAKGSGFSGRFAWRLMLLLVIGFIHNLFFSGDILTVYALLGFLLIPLQRVGTKPLFVLGLLLVFNVPGIVSGLVHFNAPPPTAQEQQLMAQSQAQDMETSKQQFDIKQNGSLAQVVHMNLAQGFADKLWFQIASGRLFITFGCFLLGLCAWRTRIFADSPQDRALIQRVALWTGVVAAVTSMIAWIFPPGMMLMAPSELWPYINGCVQQVTLAAFYFSAVLSIYWRCNATSWIHQLGPMGKMGLTSYLTQSVFG